MPVNVPVMRNGWNECADAGDIVFPCAWLHHEGEGRVRTGLPGGHVHGHVHVYGGAGTSEMGPVSIPGRFGDTIGAARIRLLAIVGYSVFTQTPEGRFELATLVRNAKNFFSIELEILEASDSQAPDRSEFVRLRLAKPGVFEGAVFRLTRRRVEPGDMDAARLAETRGRAMGMATLAERCPHLWEIDAEAPTGATSSAPDELGLFGLCAVLASVALGPVLPPDASTLFGVRGAIERLDKGQPRLRR